MYKDKTVPCLAVVTEAIEWAEWVISEDQLLELLASLLHWLLKPIYIHEGGLSLCYLRFPWTSTDHTSF